MAAAVSSPKSSPQRSERLVGLDEEAGPLVVEADGATVRPSLPLASVSPTLRLPAPPANGRNRARAADHR